MVVRKRIRRDEGQAAVEAIAVLPVLAVAVLAAWQIVVAGHAVWASAESARLAARELDVRRHGTGVAASRDRAAGVARRSLPDSLRDSLRVAFPRAGGVSVTTRVPLVFPFSGMIGRGPSFTSRAEFEV